jgi:hypothetical protein
VLPPAQFSLKLQTQHFSRKGRYRHGALPSPGRAHVARVVPVEEFGLWRRHGVPATLARVTKVLVAGIHGSLYAVGGLVPYGDDVLDLLHVRCIAGPGARVTWPRGPRTLNVSL